MSTPDQREGPRRIVDARRRKDASSIMWDLGASAVGIINRVLETPPASDSRAERDFGLNRDAQGSGAIATISQSVSTAFDNYLAAARLLRQDDVFAHSIATLVRSCAENFGRAWWLLESIDAGQLEKRDAALDAHELSRSINGIRISRLQSDGTSAVIEEDRETVHRDLLIRAGPERSPGYTKLAVAVLESADIDSARGIYSHLSGIAHGEASFTVSLSVISQEAIAAGETATARLGLNEDALRTYTRVLTQVLALVVTKLIDDWGIKTEQERWSQICDRVFRNLNALFPIRPGQRHL